MSNPLDKVIDLIKKTGDNCIILDSEGKPSYVVMDFGRYEAMAVGKSSMAGLSEDQLLAKINTDIATWKASADEQDKTSSQALDEAIEEANNAPKMVEIDQENDPFIEQNSLNEAENKEDSGQTEEKYYFEPID